MGITTKEFLEIIILIIGGGGGAAMAGFGFATYQEKQNLDKFKLELKDYQLDFHNQLYRTLTAGQKEFARKVQQNIDANQTEIGVVKCEVRDIKGVLVRQGLIHDRAGFPEENKPKHTGWTIEDA
jgi:hypothetical protein